MLSPDNHLGIFAALMGLAALAFWLQTTRLGALLTGTVLVILMAIVAANAGLIPHQAPAYDFVFTYLVPVLIPLFSCRETFGGFCVRHRERRSPS